MNEKAITAEYARTLMDLHSRRAYTPRPERRTTRKSVAHRLHRLADRLDGN